MQSENAPSINDAKIRGSTTFWSSIWDNLKRMDSYAGITLQPTFITQKSIAITVINPKNSGTLYTGPEGEPSGGHGDRGSVRGESAPDYPRCGVDCKNILIFCNKIIKKS